MHAGARTCVRIMSRLHNAFLCPKERPLRIWERKLDFSTHEEEEEEGEKSNLQRQAEDKYATCN